MTEEGLDLSTIGSLTILFNVRISFICLNLSGFCHLNLNKYQLVRELSSNQFLNDNKQALRTFSHSDQSSIKESLHIRT